MSDLGWVGARPRLSWSLNKSNVSLSIGIITTNTVTSPAQAATRTGTGENSKSDQPQCITVRCEVCPVQAVKDEQRTLLDKYPRATLNYVAERERHVRYSSGIS